MTKGWMDLNAFKFYLVLHMDEGPSSTVDTAALLATMKKSLGKHCYVLHLPAPASILEWAPSSLWLPLLEDQQFLVKYFPDQIGNIAHIGPEFFIAQDTVTSIQKFIQHLVEQLVPSMQQCVTHWNETVAAPRRGLTGRFFTASRKYFSRPASSSTSSTNSNLANPSSGSSQHASSMSINSGSALYTFDSHESILRRLGDYMFFLHQHAKASSIYQTAARSFSYDKAWKHHACALEMATVCQSLGSFVPKEIDQLHDQLLQSSATKSRNATRATLLLAHLLSKDYPALAIQLLTRMLTRETDLCAALFLEQIALLYATLKKNRLAVKYLVLAGNKYGKVGLRHHALFCFSVALAHFPRVGWNFMHDHVYASMSRHYFQLNFFDLALEFMLKLVRPFQSQELDELFFLYRHHTSPQPFYEVSVPTVQLSFKNDLCVNESASWQLCIENFMNISISLSSLDLGLSNTSLKVQIKQDKITLQPLSSVFVTLDVTALLQGPFLVYCIQAIMNNVLPVRLPFLTPVEGVIHPPQPRLELCWEGLPSSAYSNQISLVNLTLTNTGHVSTGNLEFTHDGIHVHADDLTWGPLAPQASITKLLSFQWLRSPIVMEWKFLDVNVPPYRVPLHLTLIPLFQDISYTPMVPSEYCITVTSLEHAIHGNVVGSSLPTLELAPHTSYTQVVTWTQSDPLPFPFLRSDVLYLKWQMSPMVYGFTPFLSTVPQVMCTLIHGHTATLLQPMDVSLRIFNHSEIPIHVNVQVSSDTSVFITGLVELDPSIPPHDEVTMDWICFPLTEGVYDLSQFIRCKLVKDHGIDFGKLEPSLLYVS
ncbi:hypothetical protein HMI55_000190 [Coelomomyces lativittatus]|nr:hypothetical protein HMI55_000190 [Coelomomyces lativittatus]